MNNYFAHAQYFFISIFSAIDVDFQAKFTEFSLTSNYKKSEDFGYCRKMFNL